jgi:hypothetical protein
MPISHPSGTRGGRGPVGYRLQFQDNQKLYLEFSVSNSVALVNRLRADRNLRAADSQRTDLS